MHSLWLRRFWPRHQTPTKLQQPASDVIYSISFGYKLLSDILIHKTSSMQTYKSTTELQLAARMWWSCYQTVVSIWWPRKLQALAIDCKTYGYNFVYEYNFHWRSTRFTQSFLYMHTHTHTRLTALFPGLPGWAGTRKVKTNLDFTEARDSEWQRHQLGHMQVCTLRRPTNSVKALKALYAMRKFL